MSEREEQPVLVNVDNQVGHLTLNRPAGLNTLTLPMVRTLHKQLQDWAGDPKIKAVMLRASGDKAFCAGGDIRALYESHQAGGDLYKTFFGEEYELNLYMHHYPKPILSLMHGICLGGGMGLSQATSTRIVTETARLGMPEVTIGFFPDVGGGYFLSRLPGELGTYLAVTGNHITAADALYCGLADEYIPSAQRDDLDAALGKLIWSHDPSQALREMLDGVTERSLPGSDLEAQRPAIDEHFAKNSVPEIRQSLAGEERPEYKEWAEKTVQILDSRSPTSMAVALEHLRRSKSYSLEECFEEELTLAYRIMDAGEFMEGVRALLIDKDKNPRWNPATLDEVTPDKVQSLFKKPA